uniref:RING-type domain-containing protein n=1 Tax=Tetraselmis sp. GSL018 TaxID=582737 RepID=A0A061RR73_9CHLO
MVQVVVWDDSCGFCFEKEVLEPVMTSCGHIYCRDCAVDALWCPCEPEECACPGRPCPVCRAVVQQSQLRLVIPVDGLCWSILTRRCECGERWARYSVSPAQGPIWCSACPTKPRGARNMVLPTCECGRCPPVWGLPSEAPWEATWCDRCPSRPDSSVVVRRRCECGRSAPVFGLLERSPRWCMECPRRPSVAINVALRACECGESLPSHGLRGRPSIQARWCAICAVGRGSAVVDAIMRRCECGRNKPSFGMASDFKSGRKPRWCAECPGRPPDSMDAQGNTLACVYCHDGGHHVLDCTKLTVDKQQECGYCHDSGHHILDCSKLDADKQALGQPTCEGCRGPGPCRCPRPHANGSAASRSPSPGCSGRPSMVHSVIAPQPVRATQNAVRMDLWQVGRGQTEERGAAVEGLADRPAAAAAGGGVSAFRPGSQERRPDSSGGAPHAPAATQVESPPNNGERLSFCSERPSDASGSSANQCEGPEGHNAQSNRSQPSSTMSLSWRAAAPSMRCECGRTRPSYGFEKEGRRSARWCSKCPSKPPEAVNVVLRRCECGRSQPTYGMPGNPRRLARWCAKCPQRPKEAVDLKNRRCECGKAIPNFGLPGDERRAARWCAQCPGKAPNAVDVRNRKCECGLRQATFGLADVERPSARWCAQCPAKPQDAINVLHRKCECGASTPSLALPGKTLVRDVQWCPSCPTKPPNAVHVGKRKALMHPN